MTSRSPAMPAHRIGDAVWRFASFAIGSLRCVRNVVPEALCGVERLKAAGKVSLEVLDIL